MTETVSESPSVESMKYKVSEKIMPCNLRLQYVCIYNMFAVLWYIQLIKEINK